MSADVKDFIDPKKTQPDKKPLQAGYRSFIPLSIVMSFMLNHAATSTAQDTVPPAAIPTTGLIHVWHACEVELEPTYRHAGGKDWDASLVSNLRSHTLSETVLVTILQIG